MNPLLSSLTQQASFKCKTPRLELKSSRSFLAIKRFQWTKSKKVMNWSRSIVVKLLIHITVFFSIVKHDPFVHKSILYVISILYCCVYVTFGNYYFLITLFISGFLCAPPSALVTPILLIFSNLYSFYSYQLIYVTYVTTMGAAGHGLYRHIWHSGTGSYQWRLLIGSWATQPATGSIESEENIIISHNCGSSDWDGGGNSDGNSSGDNGDGGSSGLVLMHQIDGQRSPKQAGIMLGVLRRCMAFKALLCSGNDTSP